MEPASPPQLSVVVLTWDGLPESRRCVASVRRETDVPYELLIVDNGSQPDAARFAEEAADLAILNPSNRGFAAGMNQGLSAARGTFVAFCNNDIEVPAAWASTLLEDFERQADAGIVVPAVTAAGNPCTVRSEPGSDVEVLLPFGEFPSGVVYVMRRDVAQALGGWSEEYPIASAEDLDLCFKVWANDLSVIFDQRILVDHISKATVSVKLTDHRLLYRSNLERFMDKWAADSTTVPRIEGCAPDRFAANMDRAATAIQWVRRLISTRDELDAARRRVVELEGHCRKLEQRQQRARSRWPSRLRAWIQRLLSQPGRALRHRARG